MAKQLDRRELTGTIGPARTVSPVSRPARFTVYYQICEHEVRQSEGMALPRTRVVFYKEESGNAPVLDWLDLLPTKIQDKCVLRIERLRELGHELRRPEADLLRNGMNMARKRPATSDAIQILYRRYYEGRPERVKRLEEARVNDSVARKLTSLRLRAGLTQRQLAGLVGTTASAICRLEDAEYEGHSLAMLNRIAAALKQRVEIRFVPLSQGKTLKSA